MTNKEWEDWWKEAQYKDMANDKVSFSTIAIIAFIVFVTICIFAYSAVTKDPVPILMFFGIVLVLAAAGGEGA